MSNDVEVRVSGRGVVLGDAVTEDASVRAKCGLCNDEVEAVVSLPAAQGPATYACPNCLRGRLEAITLGRWHLRSAGKGGLPWGKISG